MRLCQELVRIEERERALLARVFGGRAVRCVAHRARNVAGQGAAFGAVIAQAQHRQRIAKSGETEADPAFVRGLLRLLGERPQRCIEHVVERADRNLRDLAEFFPVERRRLAKRIADETRQVDRAEAAAPIGRQRLLTAGLVAAIVSQ
jgi:hypothetical protein